MYGIATSWSAAKLVVGAGTVVVIAVAGSSPLASILVAPSSLAKVARRVHRRRRSAPVARALLLLQIADALEGALEDLGHRPALEPRVGVDLRAMVNLVLEHHHEQTPARDRAGRIDHVDPAREPLGRRLADQRGEALGRRAKPRQPG